MDMKTFKEHLAKNSKKVLTEAPKYDGKVNAVVWHGQRSGEATIQVHQKHDRGQHGLDEAVFQILKLRLGPVLKALTRLKVDPNPIRTNEGNYHLVSVDFVCKS
jgi:hypothetical protein